MLRSENKNTQKQKQNSQYLYSYSKYFWAQYCINYMYQAIHKIIQEMKKTDILQGKPFSRNASPQN